LETDYFACRRLTLVNVHHFAGMPLSLWGGVLGKDRKSHHEVSQVIGSP